MKQHFDKPIADIIKSRHSVRTYHSEILDKELKNKLEKYAAEIKGPFNSKLRLEVIDSLDFAEGAGNRIGTYGVIKGTKGYANALGFNMQKIDIGIAMCHFEMTAGEIGMIGQFVDSAQKTKDLRTENLEYIISWIA